MRESFLALFEQLKQGQVVRQAGSVAMARASVAGGGGVLGYSSICYHDGRHKFNRRELAQVHAALASLTTAKRDLVAALAALDGFNQFDAQALRNATRFVAGTEYMLEEMLHADAVRGRKVGA